MRSVYLFAAIITQIITYSAFANVTCDLMVDSIMKGEKNQLEEILGHQHTAFSRIRFPKTAGDFLTLSELKGVTYNTNVGALQTAKGEDIYDTLIPLLDNADTQKLYVFENIMNPSQMLKEGRYAIVSAVKESWGNLNITGVVYRKNQPVISITADILDKENGTSTYVYSAKYAAEKAKVEKELKAVQSLLKEGKITQDEANAKTDPLNQKVYKAVGLGEITTVTLRCTRG